MPTYEYACRDCGEHLEVVQSFRDDPLTECPNCEGRLRKVFSAAPIVFKGSGWHIKDYARHGSEPASKPAASDSSEATTDSKGSKADSSSTSSESTSDADKKSA